MPEPEELMEQHRRVQLSRWREQLIERSDSADRLLEGEFVPAYQYTRQMESPLARQIPAGGAIVQQAPPAQVHESRRARKKREEREKAIEKAQEQERKAQRLESSLAGEREEMLLDLHYRQAAADLIGREADVSTDGLLQKEHLIKEQALLKERLSAIDLSETAALKELEAGGRVSERAMRELRWRAQRDRAAAMGDYARLLPIGSKLREKAMAAKEEQEIKADKLRRLYKVLADEHMSEEERKRDEATIERHAKYDALKSIFRADNPLAHEDATWENPITGGTLINVGRAFFGGTKPMYIFEDRSQPVMRNGQPGYKQYLFKEAVNCIGQYKPEGALVTEAAAALQERICGEYAIPAFAAIQEVDGKQRILGSFQERIELGEGLDLFSWQVNPVETEGLTDQLKSEILREHTLDWLLCNFDTKGENFLHRTDGHLSSFDKEASFSYLKKEGADHMSYEFQPHANNTLYNALFSAYAQGKIDLDLSVVQTQIDRAGAISDEEYLGMFDRMLTQKYGAQGSNKRREIEGLILARKNNLAAEYERFFADLRAERQAALARNAGAPQNGGAPQEA